jgi:hypothetical protein
MRRRVSLDAVEHRRSAFKDGAVIASSWVLLVNALEAHNGVLDG